MNRDLLEFVLSQLHGVVVNGSNNDMYWQARELLSAVPAIAGVYLQRHGARFVLLAVNDTNSSERCVLHAFVELMGVEFFAAVRFEDAWECAGVGDAWYPAVWQALLESGGADAARWMFAHPLGSKFVQGLLGAAPAA